MHNKMCHKNKKLIISEEHFLLKFVNGKTKYPFETIAGNINSLRKY